MRVTEEDCSIYLGPVLIGFLIIFSRIDLQYFISIIFKVVSDPVFIVIKFGVVKHDKWCAFF